MNFREANQRKILETKALLIDIIKSPDQFNEDVTLKSALRSQGGLAKYSNNSIVSCSLNTLKSVSELLLTRGFTELDELRINARDAIEHTYFDKKVTKNTRIGLKYKVDELQIQLDTMKKSNFLLSTIIEELRGQLKFIAYSKKSSEQTKDILNDYNKRLEVKLSYILDSEV